MTKKKTPAPRRAGTRNRTGRRSKASQARLDAIVDAIGSDPEALRKLISAMAEIDPRIIVINH